MSMEFNNYGKSKNDEPSNQDYNRPDRGGCLTAFLVVIIGANIFLLVTTLVQFFQLREYADLIGPGTMLLLFGLFAVQVFIFASAVGLWNWKEWGYNGLLAGYVISAIISLLAGSLPQVGGAIIGLVILTQLIKPVRDYLE